MMNGLPEQVNITFPESINGQMKKAGANQDSKILKKHDSNYLDVIREKPIRVTVKVLVPVREHPKFNFVGKLLGPKGNSLKRLQEQTMTKMAVLGRGSMRDRAKEEELRGSGDPKHMHLAEDLHVEIVAFAAPAEAHARIAYALAEIRRYLVPDNNDEIRKEQIREMERITDNREDSNDNKDISSLSSNGGPPSSNCGPPTSNGDRPNPPLTPPAEMHANGGGFDCCIPPYTHVVSGRRPGHHSVVPVSRGCPSMIRKAHHKSIYSPPPAKRRVLSILDKAKLALDHSYNVQEEYDHTEYLYDEYDYVHEDFPMYQGETYEGSSSCWGRCKPFVAAGRTNRRAIPYARTK